MNDQQFQDLVFRLESALTSIGSKQDISTQQLSDQLNDIAGSIETASSTDSSAKNAAVFVDTLNRNFNFNAMKDQERPDQIGANQVFIAGFTPAAASVLKGSAIRSGSNKGEIQDLLSQLPIIGPVWGTMRSIVAFFMSPINLVTLGGMATAFAALKRFFGEEKNKSFFSSSVEDIYNFLTNSLGKLVSFFTTEPVKGSDIRDSITRMWTGIIDGITKFFTSDEGIWGSLKTAFKDAWEKDVIPNIKAAVLKILPDSMKTADGDFKKITLAEAFGLNTKDLEQITKQLLHITSIDALKEIMKGPVDIVKDKLSNLEIKPFDPNKIIIEAAQDKDLMATLIANIQSLGPVLASFTSPITTAIADQTKDLKSSIEKISINNTNVSNHTQTHRNQSDPLTIFDNRQSNGPLDTTVFANNPYTANA